MGNDQIDGLVLQGCTVDSLVRAMRRLTNSRALRELFASYASAGRERFSRQNYVQEQMHIYERLHGGKRFGLTKRVTVTLAGTLVRAPAGVRTSPARLPSAYGQRRRPLHGDWSAQSMPAG